LLKHTKREEGHYGKKERKERQKRKKRRKRQEKKIKKSSVPKSMLQLSAPSSSRSKNSAMMSS
jgi:hypothetical protein